MSKGLRIFLCVIIGFAVLGALGRLGENKSQEVASSQPTDIERQIAAAKEEEARPNAQRDLVIKKASWEKGGFGAVGLHSFTVWNSSKTHDYKDVSFKFTYYGASESEVGSTEKVIYQKFPAGKTVKVKEINTGFVDQQAVTASISVD